MSARTIVLTIRGYETSVGTPEGERLTCLDEGSVPHLKAGDGSAGSFEGYARRCAEWLAFGSELEDVTTEQYPSKGLACMGETPPALVDMGLSPLPLLVTQRHLLKMVMRRDDELHHHGLGMRLVRRLPQLLGRPALAFDSATNEEAFVVMLPAVDAEGRPIIVPIKPGVRKVYEGRELEANLVLSAYGKRNPEAWLRNSIGLENVFYRDTRAVQELDELAELQLLRCLADVPGPPDEIIRQPACLCNSEDPEIQEGEGRAACGEHGAPPASVVLSQARRSREREAGAGGGTAQAPSWDEDREVRP